MESNKIKTIMQGQITHGEKSKTKKISTGAGLIVAVILAFIVLGLLLIFLNYSKTLSHSRITPSVNSFAQNNSSLNTPSNTYTQNDLINSIKLFLQTSFYPTLFSPTKDIYDYSLTWKKNNLSFFTNISINPRYVGRFSLVIKPIDPTVGTSSLENSTKQTLTNSLANTLVNTYLRMSGSYSPWQCITTTNSVFCQQVKNTNSNKLSVGVSEKLFSGKPGYFSIYACSIPSNNSLFTKNQSCL